MELTYEPLHLDKVWHSKRLWTYLQVLFQSFCLMKLLNVVILPDFEVMLEQTLNQCLCRIV
jgi:hypothetical protein